jgi:DNA-binding CsgD family transcriptional regulator
MDRTKDQSMMLNSSRDDVPHSPPQLSWIEPMLTQSQGDLMSEALRRGAVDVRNAVAYRLSEPLTALLLYLQEIKQVVKHPIRTGIVLTSVRRMSEMALLEAERIHQIVAPEADQPKVSVETGVGCRSDRINLLAPNCRVNSDGRLLEPAPPRIQPLLTPREHEVLALIAGGASSRQGGVHLGVSKRTFEVHRGHIMRKFGARNVADLVRMALGNPMAIVPICIDLPDANAGYSAPARMPSGLSA